MSLFRREIIEEKRRKLHGDVILLQPISFKLITIVLFLATLSGLIYASEREYNRKETVLGFIVPETGLTLVKADRGGLITEVFTVEGEDVKAGSPLFESQIDLETQDGFISERRLETTDLRIQQLQDQKVRVRSRYVNESKKASSTIVNLEREIETLKERKFLESKSANIAKKKLDKFKRLFETDTVTPLEYEQVEAQELQARIQLQAIEQQLIIAQSSLADARFDKENLPQDETQELSLLEQEIASLTDIRTSIEAQSLYIVRAPVDGKISNLQARRGRRVDSSQHMATIIPFGSVLEARLLVPTQAVGFLELGQDVNILLDAFPYQKFGAQKGTITEISDTPFNPGELDSPVIFETSMYQVRIRLKKQSLTAYGDELDLKPGMTLQGDIITDRRSMLEWMFDPLFAKRS